MRTGHCPFSSQINSQPCPLVKQYFCSKTIFLEDELVWTWTSLLFWIHTKSSVGQGKQVMIALSWGHKFRQSAWLAAHMVAFTAGLIDTLRRDHVPPWAPSSFPLQLKLKGLRENAAKPHHNFSVKQDLDRLTDKSVVSVFVMQFEH